MSPQSHTHTPILILCTLTSSLRQTCCLFISHISGFYTFRLTRCSVPPPLCLTSVAWLAFTVCMSAGVSTLNNYTKRVLMVGPRCNSDLNPCSFNFVGLLPPVPYYTPGHATICPPSPPRISHLSPYFQPPTSTERPTHSQSLSHSFFPPPPCHPAAAAHFQGLAPTSLPQSPPASLRATLPGEQVLRYDPEEDYSPL